MTLLIERKRRILEILENKRTIKIHELCKIFNISRATALNDLKELASDNKIIKVHGGATLNYYPKYEKSIKECMVSNLNLKKKIGLKAAQFVKDNDIIILSSGITVLEMAKHLYNKKNLTIITNSITTASFLFGYNDYNNFKIYITGGLLRKKSGSMIGLIANRTLNEFNADKAFCGVAGIDTENITDVNPSEAAVARDILAAAKESYVLIDSTKFDKIYFAKITKLRNIDVVITDKITPKKYIDAFNKYDVRLETCK